MPPSLFKRFRPLEDWKTMLGSSGETRRGAHVMFGARVTALALLAFSLNDLLSGRTTEAIQSAFVALFFVALSTKFPNRVSSRTLARMGLLAGLAIVSYESAIGANEGYTFLWLYLLPLGSFFTLGRREGLLWLCVTTAVLVWLLFVLQPRVTPDGAVGTIALATFVLLGVLGYGLESARDRQARLLEQEKSQLEQALSDLEALYGLVPICASCKSVRDDRGYWHDIETYLGRHSAVELKSALCPDCLNESGRDLANENLKSPAPASTESLPQPGFGESGHRRRRRIYFTIGMSVLVPFAGYFASIDFRAGRYLEAGLISSLLMLFVGVCALLWTDRATPQWDRAAYQLAAAGSLVVLVYEMWVGAYGGYVVLWLYSFPAISVFVLGRRGMEWSALSLVAAAILLLSPIGFAYPLAMSGRFLATFGLVTLLTYSLETARRRNHGQLTKESASLRETLDQVQTLRGMLPICPSCKKVRDDQGFWQQIETHMSRVSSARFTHGLCPTCGERVLADLEDMHRLDTTS